MNKELLEPIMRAHGDKNKDLAAAIGMSATSSAISRNSKTDRDRKKSIPVRNVIDNCIASFRRFAPSVGLIPLRRKKLSHGS